jgi:PHD/YefM family antitoxin component YafN of YafNO toxin-antitoxin module
MAGVKFVTITDFARTGSSIIMDMEAKGHEVAITKKGQPVVVLKKATGKERGEKETVSHLRNNALVVIRKVENTGKRLIITRDKKSVAVLSKITINAFRAGK